MARRDGVVVQAVAFQGQLEVAPGETVARGQVLIRGLLAGESLEHQSRLRSGQSPVVRAEGVVRARVGYDSQVELPLVEVVEEVVGPRRRSYGLEVAGRSLMIGPKPEPARVVSWRMPIQIGPFRLPVTLKLDERWPTVERRVERTLAQAWAEAEARARKVIDERVGEGATILEETVETYRPGPDRVGVRVRVETLEEIGLFVPYQ